MTMDFNAAAKVRHALKQPRKVGAWEIQTHVLGNGAWAEVRLAINHDNQHIAAVKIVPKDQCPMSPGRGNKTQGEIEVLQRLNHRNTVKLLEVIEDKDFVYIFMEYCDGGDLFDFIKATGRMSEPAAARIFNEIMQGLIHLHQEGYAHLDIKLENIFLDKSTMRVRLGDFGEASAKRSEPFNVPCGSPVYCPPETLALRPYNGEAADVWSLGCVLYCLLVGELPYGASESPAELLREIATSPLVLPEWLSEAVRDLLRQMLCKQEAERICLADIVRHRWLVQMLDELSDDTASVGSISAKASSTSLSSMWDLEGQDSLPPAGSSPGPACLSPPLVSMLAARERDSPKTVMRGSPSGSAVSPPALHL